MVEVMPTDISDLFETTQIIHDNSGSLLLIAELLQKCEPSLLLLAEADGNVISAEVFSEEMDLESAKPLALNLATCLAGNRGCHYELSTEAGARLAFAIRLPDEAERAILGGAIRYNEESVNHIAQINKTLVVCGTFAWNIQLGKVNETIMLTQVKHLIAECAALRASHKDAIADAIEERDKRIHQQRQDMVRLEAIMKLAADGIVSINEEGIIESFNEAAGEIFGYQPEEVIGQYISMLAPQSNLIHHHDPLDKFICSADAHTTGSPREVIGKRKDGSLLPLEIAVSKVQLQSGSIITGIFRDIAERKRLESQLIQAQKMESVGQLAAGIAHEINTPTQYICDNTRFFEDSFRDLSLLLAKCNQLCMSAVRGEVSEQLIADLVTAAEEADLEYLLAEIPKAIDQSLEGIKRVAKIVRSMKDFSHPGSDTMQAVDLNRALESTLTVCRNEWKYVAEVVTDFDPQLPLVTCLPGECNQVFLNLIINAAHAIADKQGDESTEKGIITVSTVCDGDYVEIRIGDTGTGISEGSQSKIFDPFFTTKEVGRGTGQGLAIAHSVITEKHRGTIDFHSEIGRGTTFIVRLPLSGDTSLRKDEEHEETNTVC